MKNTGDSTSYGLRQVIRNGQQGDKLWPRDRPQPTNTGIRYFDTDADVTVVGDLPDTLQRWDRNPGFGPGVVKPAEDGLAVAELRKKRDDAES